MRRGSVRIEIRVRTRHADIAGEESQTGKIQTEKEGEIGKGRVRRNERREGNKKMDMEPRSPRGPVLSSEPQGGCRS